MFIYTTPAALAVFTDHDLASRAYARAKAQSKRTGTAEARKHMQTAYSNYARANEAMIDTVDAYIAAGGRWVEVLADRIAASLEYRATALLPDHPLEGESEEYETREELTAAIDAAIAYLVENYDEDTVWYDDEHAGEDAQARLARNYEGFLLEIWKERLAAGYDFQEPDFINLHAVWCDGLTIDDERVDLWYENAAA